MDFRSFCDEFGPADGLDPEKNFAGIAGLMAPSCNWLSFSQQWEGLFEREKIPRPFSMKDFVQNNEDFKDARWKDQNERLRVLNLLLLLIQKAEVIPVGASVRLKDYWNLPEDCRKQLGSPYYIAFQEVTGNMGFAVANLAIMNAQSDNHLHDSGVSMVYAKLKKFSGTAEVLWNEIKIANMFGAWMRSYNTDTPINCPPLQAADIWAYSLGRMGEHHRPKKPEAEIAFELFGNLAFRAAQKHGARFFNVFDSEEMLSRCNFSGEKRSV